MGTGKISITLDDVNSARVDAEIRRQDIAARMAAHQEQVVANTPATRRFGETLFRKTVVYMAVFGLAASLVGWGVGEVVQYKDSHHPYRQLAIAVKAFLEKEPNADQGRIVRFLDNLRENGGKEFQDNPYFRRSFWNQSESQRKREFERDLSQLRMFDCSWYILLGLFIGIGLSIAEPFVGHNAQSGMRRGLLGAALGTFGGFVCSLFINDIYHCLGGGVVTSNFAQQVFARGVGWSILGAFLAIAPGIAMRNPKKFLLGLVGGAIGGLLGGILFDPICRLADSDIPARCVNILGLGVGAAVATALLEEAAKQGWLKVATGVITGKQFILYRNPTVIGSSPNAEIYLFKDPTVAPKHAAVNGVGGEFLLTALNGATVLLNGTPVRQQRLRNGDQIRVGNTIFLFGSRALGDRRG